MICDFCGEDREDVKEYSEEEPGGNSVNSCEDCMDYAHWSVCQGHCGHKYQEDHK